MVLWVVDVWSLQAGHNVIINDSRGVIVSEQIQPSPTVIIVI